MKTWAEQHDETDNGMDHFYTVKYFDFDERFRHKATLASYSWSTALYSQGHTSVTLFTADGVAHYRTLKVTPDEAARICEAHLKLNLGYTENGAPGKAIWKPHYTGD